MNSSWMTKGVLKSLVAAVSLCILASCGGGNGTQEPFRPNRVLAFGDELSHIGSDGRKYSINAYKITDATASPPTESTTELDCTRSPIWVQVVASSFGLAFDRCLGTATTAGGQILARPGNKVADLDTQINAVQGAAFNDNDLALMLVGMHDILELYARYPAEPAKTLLDEARARAAAYGARINALAQRGPAVLVLTVPDLGLTPFARAQNTSTGDAGRANLLSELTKAFNDRTSASLINDGRLIGLVFIDTDTQNISSFPASFPPLANVLDAACQTTAALPECRSNTLVTGATAGSHMWADDLRPGPTVQARMGGLAETRAKNNPF